MVWYRWFKLDFRRFCLLSFNTLSYASIFSVRTSLLDYQPYLAVLLLCFTSGGRVIIRLNRWRWPVIRYLVLTLGPVGPYFRCPFATVWLLLGFLSASRLFGGCSFLACSAVVRWCCWRLFGVLMCLLFSWYFAWCLYDLAHLHSLCLHVLLFISAWILWLSWEIGRHIFLGCIKPLSGLAHVFKNANACSQHLLLWLVHLGKI